MMYVKKYILCQPVFTFCKTAVKYTDSMLFVGYENMKCYLWTQYINNPVSLFYAKNIKLFIWTILVKKKRKNNILNALLWFSWACGNNWFRHRLQYAGMILKLILHVLELDSGHARQYAGTELSKSWALFYMCWCWTVALQSFRSPSVAIKARVCPATRYCSLLSFHRKSYRLTTTLPHIGVTARSSESWQVSSPFLWCLFAAMAGLLQRIILPMSL